LSLTLRLLKIGRFEIGSKEKNMDTSMIFLIALVGAAIILSLFRGGWPMIIDGLRKGGKTLQSMWWRVLAGILLAGFIQILIPKALIAEWIGPASGLTGIFIGTFVGMILTGGAFVIIPVIASIYGAGAAAGPIIALLAAANMTRIQGLLVMEIPFFGARIALTRFIICLFFPPLIGVVGSGLFKLF